MGTIICVIIMAALGLCMIIWPKIFCILRHGLYVKDAEPSELGLFVERVAGAILIVCSIFIAVFSYLF